MNKTTVILGILAYCCAILFKISPYFEGLSFDRSWFIALIVFPIMGMSTIGLLALVIAVCISMIRKKTSIKVFCQTAMILVVLVGVFWVPSTHFVDGLQNAVRHKLNRNRLLELAQRAKHLRHNRKEEYILELQEIYPEAFSMNALTPRLSVSENEVRLYYGSALTKHWGYTIVNEDRCPLNHIPPNNCRKVYDNIWVFLDIY